MLNFSDLLPVTLVGSRSTTLTFFCVLPYKHQYFHSSKSFCCLLLYVPIIQYLFYDIRLTDLWMA